MRLTLTFLLLACLGCMTCSHGKTIANKRKHIHHKPEATKNAGAAKKQDMSFNDEMPGQELNEGPVGKVQNAAGIEGLGGEMNGIPTGMGAGAEPLGAFENEDTPPGTETQPQSLGEDQPNGLSESNLGEQGGAGGMTNEASVKMKAPAISMSHSLDDLDNSVNIQGDGEIGKYVRNSRQGGMGTGSESMIGLEAKDPPFTGHGPEDGEGRRDSIKKTSS